jgi:hypothetical protein
MAEIVTLVAPSLLDNLQNTSHVEASDHYQRKSKQEARKKSIGCLRAVPSTSSYTFHHQKQMQCEPQKEFVCQVSI